MPADPHIGTRLDVDHLAATGEIREAAPRCTCAGEGRCAWCTVPCPACGVDRVTGCECDTVSRLVAEVDALRSPACPAGHPGAALASSDEGTVYCRWCEDVERLRAERDEAQTYAEIAGPMLLAEVGRLRAELAAERGEAGPEGWTYLFQMENDGWPNIQWMKGDYIVWRGPTAPPEPPGWSWFWARRGEIGVVAKGALAGMEAADAV